MTHPDPKRERPFESSGIRPHGSRDPATSGARCKDSLSMALADAVRGALQLAQAEESRVQLVLRGDPAAGQPLNIVEGVVSGFRQGSDGRERVVVRISEDADRVVPIDGIVRVLSA